MSQTLGVGLVGYGAIGRLHATVLQLVPRYLPDVWPIVHSYVRFVPVERGAKPMPSMITLQCLRWNIPQCWLTPPLM
jgi:hypothetical protein